MMKSSCTRLALALALMHVVTYLLVTSVRVCGDPIPAPELEKCHPGAVEYPHLQMPIECCPVLPTRPIVDFSFSSLDNWPMRVRPPAHKLDPAASARLNRAYQLMKSLPDDDPRSLVQQQRMHCAYCSSSFPTAWNTSESLQIHWSWLLLPWHRWFLYFHERILASLLDDDTFALPFWNWDNQRIDVQTDENGQLQYMPGTIPLAYCEEEFLGNVQRTKQRLPPARMDLSFNPFKDGEKAPSSASIEQRRQSNLNIMHQVMVSAGTTAPLFEGKAYRYGDSQEPSATSFLFGTLEAGPHGNVHVWIGDEDTPDFALMGNVGISGTDPTFYIHHANVDRLWEVWKSIPGGWRHNSGDPDWLNSQFVFYDENADLVRVRIADCLDIAQLRYSYESVQDGDNEWMTYNASRCSSLSELELSSWLTQIPHATQSVVLVEDAPVTIAITRPQPPEGAWEEVLVLDGVRAEWRQPVLLEVYLMLAGKPSTVCAELAGILTSPASHGQDRAFGLRLAIGAKLRQLEATGLGRLAVTLQAGPQRLASRPITIDSVRIELVPAS